MTGMGWRDRLIMKVMGNKLVVRLLSMPIVLNILMWEAQVFVSTVSVLKRHKKATR